MSNIYAFSSGGHRFDDGEAVVRQNIVDSLKRALDGLGKAENFHVFFADAIEHRVWELDRQLAAGSIVHPMSFNEFISKPFPKGLGSDHDTVKRLLAGTALFDNYDDLMTRGPGNPNPRDPNTGRLTPSVDNIHKRDDRPTGTSEAAGLRRLRKAADAGDSRARQLRDDVLSGRTSVHRACVELGFRKPTITIRDEPAAVLEIAAKRVPPAEMARCAWRLMSPADQQQFLDWAAKNVGA